MKRIAQPVKRRGIYSIAIYLLLIIIVVILFLFAFNRFLPEWRYNHQAFPRLGMWWLDPYKASVEEMARYNLLIDSFDTPELQEKLEELKRLNPEQKIYKPISPSERQLFISDWVTGQEEPNPEIRRLPVGFFLLQTGTDLTYSIDQYTDRIVVDHLYDGYGVPLFRVGSEVAIGEYESAKVTEILWKERTLRVSRGYVRPSSRHVQGTKIASHIQFWPGTWVMNITDACPIKRVPGLKEPVNYITYYFKLITGQVSGVYSEGFQCYDTLAFSQQYDGIAIDRFEDAQSWLKWVNGDGEIQLDLYHDNLSAQRGGFDASWKVGTRQLISLMNDRFPEMPIIRNNPISEDQAQFKGQIYETYGWSNPTTQWWRELVVSSASMDPIERSSAYLEWPEDALRLFEVYEDEATPMANGDGAYQNPADQPDFKPNYQRMRFGLTSALLGNGYFSYEVNTDGHGALGLLWFDEYDLGTGQLGYLGFPKSEAVEDSTGVFSRKFERGLVLVNPTTETQTLELDKYYQHIKGTQVPEINTGAVTQKVTLSPMDGVILLRLPWIFQWSHSAQQFEE